MSETLFTLPITKEVLDYFEVSFTAEEFESAVESDDKELYEQYRREFNAALRKKPRWVFIYRHRFGTPGFFTEQLPVLERMTKREDVLFGG